MRVVIAEELGFCFGVKRAIQMVEKAVAQQGGIETIGDIVHNQRVVESLQQKNVAVASSLQAAHGQLVAITAHGAPPDLYEEARERGLEILDTTCPYVTKAQRAARALAEAGFDVVVYGDPEHPEVRGLLGWAGPGAIAGKEWSRIASGKSFRHKIGLVSQTTQAPEHFARFLQDMLNYGLESVAELRAVNTICRATIDRQSAVKKLASEVSLVLVVGSRTSANTKHLVELAANAGAETHLIESPEEVQLGWLIGREAVGITAGASTPGELISEVVDRVNALARE